MSKTIDDHRSRLGEIRGRLEEINTEYAGEMLPEDVAGEWKDLIAEQERTDETVKELELRMQTVERLAGSKENREAGAAFHVNVRKSDGDIYDLVSARTESRSPEHEAQILRDRAMTSLDRSTIAHDGVDEAHGKTHVERLLKTSDTRDAELARLMLTTGSPLYERAFGKYLVGAHRTSEEERALSTAASGGGYAVPYTLDPTVIPTSNSSINPWRAISRVEQIVGSNTWQGVSSAGVTASRIAEATEATDGAPTLAQPTATVTKAHVFVPFSIEVDQDWGGLQAQMARLIQDAKDDEEAVSFATGAGTTVNPQGVVTGTTNTVAAQTGLTVTAANLYALEAALPPRFRPNETFVMNRSIFNIVRAIDTAGGASLIMTIGQGLNNTQGGNTGVSLMGAPLYESSAMQATVVNATKIAIVGDFRYFLIVDRVGLTVEVVPHLFGATNRFPTGQRGLYAYWRNTSKVLDANAFRALTGTT